GLRYPVSADRRRAKGPFAFGQRLHGPRGYDGGNDLRPPIVLHFFFSIGLGSSPVEDSMRTLKGSLCSCSALGRALQCWYLLCWGSKDFFLLSLSVGSLRITLSPSSSSGQGKAE
ncbi:hypothetical protein LZ30DRAFT_788945, partial [Colletotrichum cereale]